MSALATLPAAAPLALVTSRRLLVDECIAALEPEAAMASGAALDAQVMRALGWEVQAQRPSYHEARTRAVVWRCRSPWAATWLPLPRVSANAETAADYVLPSPHWSWAAGRRDGAPFAWCMLDERAFFEAGATARTPARCMLRVALHAQRWALRMREDGHG